MSEAILVVAAVVPAVWLLVCVYRADKLEKEPAGLLISLVLLGIVITTLAAVTEQIGDAFLTEVFPQGGLVYNFILYFIVVALSEEGFKYLLLKIRTWKSPHFNCSFDGVVYAVFVSLGFALWENIAYVLEYGIGTAIARALTAVPGHACFGVFMGVYYGIAKRMDLAGEKKDSKVARRKALWIPLLLHGTYDFIASLENDWWSLAFLAFMIWMFVSALKLIKKASAEDSPLMQERTTEKLTNNNGEETHYGSEESRDPDSGSPDGEKTFTGAAGGDG